MQATRQHRVRTGELKRHIVSSAFHPLLPRHLENDLQLDWSAERKACDAIHQAARALVFSEDVLQQLRSGISDFRLIADISRSGHRHAEPDDPRHFVERCQVLSTAARRWPAESFRELPFALSNLYSFISLWVLASHRSFLVSFLR